MPETTLAIRLAVRDVEEARRRLKSLGVEGERALDNLERGAADADRGFRRLDSRLERTQRSFVTFGRSIAGVLAIFGGFSVAERSIRGVVETSLQFERVSRALQFATGSTTQAREEFEFLRRESERLNFALLDSAERYASFSAAARTAGIEQNIVRETFLGVSEAAVTLGLSTDATRRVLLALEQIASKGRVSMEELRQQLGEALPGALGIAAQGLGVTTQELERMVEQGLDARTFLQAFGPEVQEAFGDQAESAANDLQGSLNRLTNAYDELKLTFAQSGVIEDATGALIDFANFLQRPEVIDGIRAFGGAIRDLFEQIDREVRRIQSIFDAVSSFIRESIASVGGLAGPVQAAEFVGELPADVRAAAIAMEDYVAATSRGVRPSRQVADSAEDTADETENAARAQRDFNNEMEDLIRLREREAREAERAAEEARRTAERQLEEARAAAERQADLLLEPARNAIRSVQGLVADTFQDVLSGGTRTWRELWDSFTSIATRALAEIAAQRIFVNIIPNIGGGAAGFGNILGANSIVGLAPGLASSINQLGGGIFSPGLAPGQFGPPVPGLFGTGTTLTGALGAGGLGALGGNLVGSLFGLNNAGRTGATVGGGVGAFAGSLFGPLGALAGGGIGTALGSLIGSLFGGESFSDASFQNGRLVGAPAEFGQIVQDFDRQVFSALDTRTRGLVESALSQLTTGAVRFAEFDLGEEGFRLLRARATAALGAAAPGASAEALFAGINVEQAGNVEALTQRLTEFLGLVQRIRGEDVIPAVQAMRDLRAEFAEFEEVARTVGGVSIREIRGQLREELRAIRQTALNELRALAGVTVDPFRTALENVRATFDAARRSADELGISRRRLNRLERQAVRNLRTQIRDQIGGLNDQLASAAGQARQLFDTLLEPLRQARRGLISSRNPQAQFGALERRFGFVSGRALRGNVAAIEELPGLAQQLLGAAGQFGGSALLATVTETVNRVLGRVINRTENQQDRIPDLINANRTNTVDIITAYREETRELRREIRKLRGSLQVTR